MSRSEKSEVQRVGQDQKMPDQVDPVLLRRQALISFLREHGYTNPQLERLIGVGRPKPARSGDETTGERIGRYLDGTYDLVPVRYAALCAGVCADGKIPPTEDDFEHWGLPTPLRQAKLPLLLLSQLQDGKPVSKIEVRRWAIGLQEKVYKRRRGEKDQLRACVSNLAERLLELMDLLVGENVWTSTHVLFEFKPWGDIAQLDVSGTGTTFFTYRWDQPCSNPFDIPLEHPQPIVFKEGEESPKDRFQCLLRHLDESLRCIAINKDVEGSAPAREIRKQAKSVRRAIASLLKRMNAPRLVSWDVSHPICLLDDDWWETHPDFSPVLICQKLPNGQDWCPLPEDLPAQPILFAAEHNTPEKRCLRFLALMRDATLSVQPDMMVDIGADLIGMDAWKSLHLIARHGWV